MNLALIGLTILFSTIKVGRLLFVCKFAASSTVHDVNQYNATDRKRQLEVDEGDGLREDGRWDEEGRASFWKNISLSEVIASGFARQKLCLPRSTQSGPVTYLTSQRTPPQKSVAVIIVQAPIWPWWNLWGWHSWSRHELHCFLQNPLEWLLDTLYCLSVIGSGAWFYLLWGAVTRRAWEMNPNACQPMHGLVVLPKYEVGVSTAPPEIIPSKYGKHRGSVEGFVSCFFYWRINLIHFIWLSDRIGSKNKWGLDKHRSGYKGGSPRKIRMQQYQTQIKRYVAGELIINMMTPISRHSINHPHNTWCLTLRVGRHNSFNSHSIALSTNSEHFL